LLVFRFLYHFFVFVELSGASLVELSELEYLQLFENVLAVEFVIFYAFLPLKRFTCFSKAWTCYSYEENLGQHLEDEFLKEVYQYKKDEKHYI